MKSCPDDKTHHTPTATVAATFAANYAQTAPNITKKSPMRERR
jgi:hypothetical protein